MGVLLRLGPPDPSNGDFYRSSEMGVRSFVNGMKWRWGLGETSRHGRHRFEMETKAEEIRQKLK